MAGARTLKFKATIEPQGPGGAWCFMKLPVSIEKEWGIRARVAVKGTVNGFAFQNSLFPTGDGSHHMMFSKELQAGAHAGPGDTVRVVLQQDTAPRVYEAPGDLKKALVKNAKAKSFWETLRPSSKKYTLLWIEESKKAETRAARIAKTVALLAQGKSPK
ncbi:MAG TPA: YdeI/OmpD-associated family protein [Candidatus Nitrosotenuis sp.]|nr:YdeI/OmpD-associated family protein [Candidatus Nitrosotenuis sp.]